MRVDDSHRLVHQPQRAVDVLEHADGVGDHDVVERSLDGRQRLRIFGVAQDEMQVGMTGVGPDNGLRAEIDPDAVGGPQRRQHVAAAAAQLEHALARRNQELRELQVVFTVSGVEIAPAKLLAGASLGLVQQHPFSGT